MDLLVERALLIRNRLLDAYGPPVWRNKLPAIDELVSTILSQNTNDANRDRAFDQLVSAYPTWEEVRDADPEGVVDAIRPAGLANQKGPRIQQILAQITQERGSLDLTFLSGFSVQGAMDWLLRFKGVGPKTASIVLLFSLGMPAFPVDTHIYRVTGRIGLRPESMSADQAHDHLARVFPSETYFDVHLNLIRHGREVCRARSPLCPECILKDVCDYFEQVS